ncbi:MAG: hypothetical protein AAFQ65_00465 [Myxococcota bacterium]
MIALVFTFIVQVDPGIESARKAYDENRLEDALSISRRAKADAKTVEQRIALYELDAKVHLAQDRTESAIADFVSILRLDPTYRGSGVWSPKIVSALSTAREIIEAEQAIPRLAANPPTPPLKDSAKEATPFYRTWWFWTTVGLVAGGAGALAYFESRPEFNENARGPFPIRF